MACCDLDRGKDQTAFVAAPALEHPTPPHGKAYTLDPRTPVASTEAARLISLVESVLREQSGFTNVLQQHQQTLIQRFELQQQQLEGMINTMNSKLTPSTFAAAHQYLEPKDATCNVQSDPLTARESQLSKLSGRATQSNNGDPVTKDPKRLSERAAEAITSDPRAKTQDLMTSVASSIFEEPGPQGLVARILLNKWVDRFSVAVILANMFSLVISLQIQGLHHGWKLGLRQDDANWSTAERIFGNLEYVYNSIYLIELTMRLWVHRLQFLRSSKLHTIDALIVLLSCFDCFVLKTLKVNIIDLSVLRLLRIGKLLRSLDSIAELRVLLRTLSCAIPVVFWSVLLLAMIIVGGGILMCQMAFNYLDDPSISRERTIWLYNNFGTCLISIYTMFVSTFTASWVGYARPLIDDVSYMFAAIWISWVILVNFTTMRVIGALFLRQTMNVSALDAESHAMIQLRRKPILVRQLEKIFLECDTDGDGRINHKEFEWMIKQRRFVAKFSSMGLDIDELRSFFAVVTADDGEADFTEFISGAIAMATSAPTLNQMIALQNQLRMESKVQTILENTSFMRSKS